MSTVTVADAREFATGFADGSVALLLMDPPYGGLLNVPWDRQWPSPQAYAAWFLSVLRCWRRTLTPTGSVIFFGGTGTPGQRTLLHTILALEDERGMGLYCRNWITWKKRRAYGKSHDYLYTREEILWYSASPARTGVTFNIPYLDEKRGYEGWNKDFPAKSEFKRVSNVWTDIPELMRPMRPAEKPTVLMERLVLTHSNPGDLVVDPFCGTGATGEAALKHGRRFRGADTDPAAVQIAAVRLNILLDELVG